MKRFVKARIVFIIKDKLLLFLVSNSGMYWLEKEKKTHFAKGFCLVSSPRLRRSIPAVCSLANFLKTNRPIFMTLRVLIIQDLISCMC
jgi:hypothetical protein